MQVALCNKPSPAAMQTLARLHLAAFPGFFLTSLGPGFLRLLYAGFAHEPVGIHAT